MVVVVVVVVFAIDFHLPLMITTTTTSDLVDRNRSQMEEITYQQSLTSEMGVLDIIMALRWPPPVSTIQRALCRR